MIITAKAPSTYCKNLKPCCLLCLDCGKQGACFIFQGCEWERPLEQRDEQLVSPMRRIGDGIFMHPNQGQDIFSVVANLPLVDQTLPPNNLGCIPRWNTLVAIDRIAN